MDPALYSSQPNRRKSDPIVQEVRDITESAMLSIEKTLDETVKEIDRKIDEQEARSELHRGHVDRIIEGLSDGIKLIADNNERSHRMMMEGNQALINKVEKLIDVQAERFHDSIVIQGDRIDSLSGDVRDLNERVGCVETLVQDHKTAKDKADAEQWRELKGKVIGAIIGIGLAAIGTAGAVAWAVFEKAGKVIAP